MNTYNQRLDKYSSNWCTIYWIYHIILLKFWIEVTNNFILKTLTYFEKIWVRFPKWGASFTTIYKSFETQINKKLWINIKVVTKQIKELKDNDTWTRWIGMPKYHSWLSLIKDWSFDYDDVEKFLAYSWKTFGHHLAWDGSNWWYLINSDWTEPIKCNLKTLNYMVEKWVIRATCRTIEPATDTTRQILSLTLWMKKAGWYWKLKQYLETNKINTFLSKAIELYNYGK
jgi:hypothetical protein